MSRPTEIAKTLRPKDRKKLKGLVAAAMKSKRRGKTTSLKMLGHLK
jgi:hypothetical protein